MSGQDIRRIIDSVESKLKEEEGGTFRIMKTTPKYGTVAWQAGLSKEDANEQLLLAKKEEPNAKYEIVAEGVFGMDYDERVSYANDEQKRVWEYLEGVVGGSYPTDQIINDLQQLGFKQNKKEGNTIHMVNSSWGQHARSSGYDHGPHVAVTDNGNGQSTIKVISSEIKQAKVESRKRRGKRLSEMDVEQAKRIIAGTARSINPFGKGKPGSFNVFEFIGQLRDACEKDHNFDMKKGFEMDANDKAVYGITAYVRADFLEGHDQLKVISKEAVKMVEGLAKQVVSKLGGNPDDHVLNYGEELRVLINNTSNGGMIVLSFKSWVNDWGYENGLPDDRVVLVPLKITSLGRNTPSESRQRRSRRGAIKTNENTRRAISNIRKIARSFSLQEAITGDGPWFMIGIDGDIDDDEDFEGTYLGKFSNRRTATEELKSAKNAGNYDDVVMIDKEKYCGMFPHGVDKEPNELKNARKDFVKDED